MCTANQSLVHGTGQGAIQCEIAGRIDLGYIVANTATGFFSEHVTEFTCTQFLMSFSEQEYGVSTIFEIARDGFANILVVTENSVE